MADVGACNRPLPEAVDHLLGGDVPPALREVPFIFYFIEDDRLVVDVAVEDARPKSATAEPFWMLAWLTQGWVWL